ncbi:MAG TPA: CRISPR-associated helicase Cas3' [Candidatus Nitrosotenuis sp.]|nr:CRISPR-associated helicase Cas3' [Candidatus Nitrosotenuis sp.]
MSDAVILAKDNGETLAEHTLRCLRAAEILLRRLPFNDDVIAKLERDLKIALAVHDVGKAATGFQKVLRGDMEKWAHRHEILSAAFGSYLGLGEEILLAVITHHKSLPTDGVSPDKGCLPYEEIPWPTDLTPVWNEMAKEWNDNIITFKKEWKKIIAAIGWKVDTENIGLSPLWIDKSWLRRNKQSRNIEFQKRYYASVLRGLLVSSDHIGSNIRVDLESALRTIPLLNSYQIAPHNIRTFQRNAGKVNGHLILRAPTGSGKTVAALLWAQTNQKKNGRLFYVLPNIASINAMHDRLKSYFGDDNVGLLHSRAASSLYSIFESDGDLTSRLRNQGTARMLGSLAREMWFPVRVCTPHQVLRYSLHGKGWETMLSEFPNSCFIFDEIHAYDPSITGLTVATAKHLITKNASCLFLSATMPEFLRKQVLEREIPSISFLEPSTDEATDNAILELKRHNYEIIGGDIMSNIDLIVKEAEKARSTLVVCNHVPTAQQVYAEIRNRIKETVLLHSRFCKRDRNRIEQKIRESLPKILVSTQVVEVSLDVDFDQGFLEPAPLDALVQRFGRINRYGKRQPAPVRIFEKQLHRYNIYDKKFVDKSLQELSSLANPLREQDLVRAADRVYSQGYSDESKFRYENALNHPLIRDFENNLIAGINYDWVEDVIDRADGTIDLLPVSLRSTYEKLEEEGLTIEAADLLVPVRTGKSYALAEYVDKSHDPWIIKMPYSDTIGLNLDIDGDE